MDRSCFEDYHTKNDLQDIFSFILHANCWSLNHNVSKKTWIFMSSFRNLSSPLRSKEITAFLRHSGQCLFPSPQYAFCFTNLSRLVLEIFRFCEYHAQNLSTLQKNSASWDLHLGFNLAFKGLNHTVFSVLSSLRCAAVSILQLTLASSLYTHLSLNIRNLFPKIRCSERKC